jgi:hypothetical protein
MQIVGLLVGWFDSERLQIGDNLSRFSLYLNFGVGDIPREQSI